MLNSYIYTILLAILFFAQSVTACSFNYLSPLSSWPGIQSQLQNIQVHTGAESGFFKKIELIKQASHGDELSLMYFIYDQDFTSSHLSKELIYAAKRGAKVSLLVDYFMAQKSEHTLSYLQSFTNITVKLFRPPTPKFHKYLRQELELQDPQSFTMGLARQNAELIQKAILSSPELSKKLNLLQKSNPTYQDIMLALYQLEEYKELPLFLEEYSQRLHHKWLGLQKKNPTTSLEFIVGGRNISDEYHVGLDELTKKRRGLLRNRNYPFIDTEVSALSREPHTIDLYNQRFQYLWSNEIMTSSIIGLDKSSPLFKSMENKINYRVSIIKKRQDDLKKRISDGRINLTPNKLSSYYSENAPHIKYVESQDSTSGKDINLTWKRLMANAKPENGPIKIISAYLYLYPDLLESLKGALNRNVTIEIYTNSMQTTDLSVINIGTYKELSNWKSQLPNSQLLKIYELQVPKGRGSLHSKIIKIGSHIGIGSANSDPRSFLFDTNNVLFLDLSQSPQLAQDIVNKYLQSTKFNWSELTPTVLNLIRKQLSKQKKTKQILKALEVPFFQNQL